MKLMAIGKGRFETIYGAVREGKSHCPYDLRFGKTGEKALTPKAECVHGFLTKLYEQAAESLPDGVNSNKRPRQGSNRFDDPTLNRDAIKHLPPGSISEYHAQCQALNPQYSISKKLFSSVSWVEIESESL